MPYLFENLDKLRELLRISPFGLITDVDGTISLTAQTPQQAVVTPLCRHYLSILSKHITLVAAVSGRPVMELKDMVNIEGMRYIGNHGMEILVNNRPALNQNVLIYSEAIKSMIKGLKPLLSMDGITIQNKGVTATIHYRLSSSPRKMKEKIMTAIAGSPDAGKLRVVHEKMAVDLLPPVDINKGTSVLDLIKEYELQSGIYLGDDTTDIDAFRAIRKAGHSNRFRGFSIAVLNEESPKTITREVDFTLNGVPDVERFLEWAVQILT